MTKHLMNTYARQPIGFVKGEGSWLIDDQGKRYLVRPIHSRLDLR